MDLNSIAEFVKTYLLEHWPFVAAALILGFLTHFFKARVWTKARAAGIIDPNEPTLALAKTKFCRFMRTTLPLHAPFIGTVAAIVMVKTLGADEVPRSPGVDGAAAVVMYYLGAGVVSSWVFAAWKRVLKSRGINSEIME